MTKRIAMLGAGSGFTDEITKGLCACELLHDSTFVLMDVDDHRLADALERNQKLVEDSG
ncbi:MAG TPA: alpha-glucosidase/alpha-galactosidase, partial [Candidatus Poseidoniia archaeon]|nr:alpha-glucosidase/alpha-galactosidase [Candidatus Poseidoniia archaeon]